jgi:hypothetical protein
MTRRIRRRLAIGVFLALALAFLAATHAYLAQRLVLDPGWPEPARSLALAAIALCAVLLVAHTIAERALPRSLARWVSWPASLWMGAGFWLLLLLLASDALLWPRAASRRPPTPRRRRDAAPLARARSRSRLTGAAIAAGCAAARAARAAPRGVRDRALAARARRLPDRPDLRHPHRPAARARLRGASSCGA